MLGLLLIFLLIRVHAENNTSEHLPTFRCMYHSYMNYFGLFLIAYVCSGRLLMVVSSVNHAQV